MSTLPIDDGMMKKDDLIKHLETNSKVFKNIAIKEAFEAVDRARFVQEDYVPEAYEDYMLPIPAGQKISKPTITAFMLELLDIKKGQHVLEVGTGSGWTTALLAHMAGPKGTVVGTEKVAELVTLTKENIKRCKIGNVEIVEAGDTLGFPKSAPYDRIFVTASANEVPATLVEQLAVGGIMVIPVETSLIRIEKTGAQTTKQIEYPSFDFDHLA